MKLTHLIASTLTLLGACSPSVVLGRPAPNAAAPDVDVQIKFPDNNAFGRVINGASNNILNVRLDNHGMDEVVLSKIYGEYYEPHGREKVLRKTTVSALREVIPGGTKSRPIAYSFHSENKIGEVGLRVFVEMLDAKKKVHKVLGYQGAVTIIEQPGSWFDPALLFTYVVLASFIGFVSYLVYGSYLQPSTTRGGKKWKNRKSGGEKGGDVKDKVKEEVGNVVEGVDESWLPDHILRQRKAKGAKGAGATSGSESEGTPSKAGKKGRT
ncbi:BQ2448_7633 [Microbotryum intermedium]|uniref:BQ2448_7633 protein n=1 Tax=Microbotryum intermedium TaxID=269621 RepID=A0A238FRX1_9BASI|nr:BQ2448_7633 [Microbotryum intermedium]